MDNKETKDLDRQEKSHRKRTKKKKFDWKFLISLIIPLSIFIFSACKLVSFYLEYQEGSVEYTQIENEVVEEVDVDSDMEIADITVIRPFLKIDFDALKKKNNDVIGWIHFDQPEIINYPILAGIDNDKYLRRTVEGKYNSAGSIFADKNASSDFSDTNTFIYGHNMKNGSMFGGLKKFKDIEYRNKNPYFYIYTPDGTELMYEIFAACVVHTDDELYDRSYENDAEFQDYLKRIQKKTVYGDKIEMPDTEKIVSLSTCTSRVKTERLIVFGALKETRNINELEKSN